MRKYFIVLLILSLLMVCVVPCYSQGGRDYQARVLTVSKWIDLSGRIFNRVVIPFTDGDTTPSVYSSNTFKEENTGATVITTFDDSRIGQRIAILFTTTNTTIDFTGTNLLGNGGVDWTSVVNSVLIGYYDGTNWYCSLSAPSVFPDPITTGDITIQQADPTLFWDTVTAGDTDFWMGIQEDAAGDDTDTLEIGIGGTKGANVRWRMDKDGNISALRTINVGRILPSTAKANFHGFSGAFDVSALDATSILHVLHVEVVGSTSGEVTAVGTTPGVKPIHQHVGTFVTPSQTEYAARLPDGGSWTDGIDTHQIFVDDDDEILIGDAAVFDQLEVILSVVSSKDTFSEFYFYDTSPAWVEFFPSDPTNGFRNDGIIEWNSDNLTNWKSDYDPGGADGSAGYYIKIKRTRNVIATPPTPTTIKILAATAYEWDENGDLTVREVIHKNEDFIDVGDIVPTGDGAGNDVTEIRIADGTNKRLYNRTTGVQDTQDTDWYAEKAVSQTPTSLTLWTRASDFANCVMTIQVWNSTTDTADPTGAVTITPTGNGVWEEFTYTITGSYSNDDEMWIVIAKTSLDTGDTLDFGRIKVFY